MEEVAAQRLDTHHRPQELGIAGDQFRGQQAAADQLVVAVDVGEQHFEQLGALLQSARNMRPFVLADDQRHMGQGPGSLLAFGAVILAVEHPGIAQILVGALEAGGEFVRPQFVECLDQHRPGGADIAFGIQHLVGYAGQ